MKSISFVFLFNLLLLLADKVDIITRSGCGYSDRIREYLRINNIDFSEYNVTTMKHDKRKDIGMPTATFPLVFLNGDYFGGCEDFIAFWDVKKRNEY